MLNAKLLTVYSVYGIFYRNMQYRILRCEVNMTAKKTPLMMLVESRDPHGRDIKSIMLSAYREHRTQSAAANAIGVSREVFNQWATRLGLSLRRHELTPSLWTE